MEAFLDGRLSFLGIADAVEEALAAADGAPARDLDELTEADAARATGGGARMSWLIAILGLAFLVLIHEAGHFYSARALGMRPRRFYLGFPPAIVKVNRGGIEYGIGAIPLGGYVKIPGMHRPAPSDLDVHFGPALRGGAGADRPIERMKRKLGRGEFERRAPSSTRSRRASRASSCLPRARESAERGLNELRDGLGRDAYWRATTWKRVERHLRRARGRTSCSRSCC